MAIFRRLFIKELPAGQRHNPGGNALLLQYFSSGQNQRNLGTTGNEQGLQRSLFGRQNIASESHTFGRTMTVAVDNRQVLPGQDQRRWPLAVSEGNLPGHNRLVGVGGADDSQLGYRP